MLQIALLAKQEVIELLTKLTDLEESGLSLEMENLQAKKFIVNSQVQPYIQTMGKANFWKCRGDCNSSSWERKSSDSAKQTDCVASFDADV